jgi:hypothetical protein
VEIRRGARGIVPDPTNQNHAMHTHEASLVVLFALGAMHGINPAMGWLFAVSLGLQEQRSRAVWRALGPLALGHALAVAVTLAIAGALGLVIPIAALKWITAVTLVAFGIFHLRRHRHPRLAGMRVGPGDLTIWSFLMAAAHGAGLMALPFALSLGSPATGHPHDGLHAHHVAHAADPILSAGLAGIDTIGLIATLVHTVGYLAVAGAVAVVVYERLGLRLLRTAWVNLNAIWAAALVLTGVLTVWL